MTEMYKSAAAGKVMGEINVPMLTPEREKRVLSGNPASQTSVLDAKINEYNSLQKELDKVGTGNSIFSKGMYRVLDLVGVSSPTTRKETMMRHLESKVAYLANEMSANKSESEKVNSKVRDATDLMYDGGLTMSKYEAIRDGMLKEMGDYRSEQARIRTELDTPNLPDSKRHTLLDELNAREREQGRIEDDLDLVQSNIETAATTTNMAKAASTVYDSNKVKLKGALKLLQGLKTTADRKLNSIGLYIDGTPGKIANTLIVVRDTAVEIDNFTKKVGGLPEQMDKVISDAITGTKLPTEDSDYRDLVERTKNMKRDYARQESDNVAAAKEALRSTWSG